MAQQTKADRKEAAQKAAATRKRNATRKQSQVRGKKAASTSQAHKAQDSLSQAGSIAKGAVSGVSNAARAAGNAAREAGKSVATRSGVAKTKKR